MVRNRSLLFFGLAILLAFGTSIMAYNWFQNQTPAPQVKKIVKFEGTPIVVASADLPWGTPLTKEMVRVVNYPAEHLPEGRFENIDMLPGRVVLTHLKRNEPILESKLAPLDIKNGGVGGVLHPGMRAMAVRVNEVVGVSGFLKPGDRVDIMVTLQNRGKREKITKTVLENTLILAAGTQMERKGPGEKPRAVKVITFEVSLEEAEKLALASTEGKLRLALRSPINTEPELTKGATTQNLLSSYRAASRAPVAKRRAISRDKVELIKGTNRKYLSF
ncbi:Flp pilus assembly protein CpaB [Candidatus Nitronereus thalassa]|uniref:Flp pilus assembly protein CpaB n=1 Tax=Candidatus Nitronereus thalassa TaxID=3020898 RepID=A0ABU3K3Q0_9BACT|nr:Flp pilus assembly protein CpaB [Candidatus Nitronereus thalassa]MDT7041001.1 Flp pilus assembly protein CpaB [Candidatus Nitronereus thalassa]